ncbi:MAG: class I SAM-dependent methyltransferase [Olsenella sp.]|nr:class I SAM-dependent methyltransferase [Olsenella sp.]
MSEGSSAQSQADLATARRLVELTEAFYAQEAQSFSSTRKAAWEGWRKIFSLLAAEGRLSLSVTDAASGNGRFGRALAEALPQVRIRYQAIDSCAPLMDEAPSWPASLEATCFERDLIAPLLEGAKALPSGIEPADLLGCFGFLHHVPDKSLRLRFVQELVDATAAGGIIALALWRFADTPAGAQKAEEATRRACQELGIARDALEPGDYLLGWQGKPGVWRYCHSFTEHEAQELAHAVRGQASVMASYLADGKTHDQNRYLVLRKSA